MKGKKKIIFALAMWAIIIFAAIEMFSGDKTAEPEKEKVAEQKVEEPKIDFSTDALTVENVKKAAEQTFVICDNVEVSIIQGLVNVTFRYDSVPNAKSLIRVNIKNAVEFAQKVFASADTEELWITTYGGVLDAKGAESEEIYSKYIFTLESIKGVNWDNFIGMVIDDPLKIENITDNCYIIHFLRKEIS